MALYLGEGSGTFKSGSWFATSENLFSIVAGNFDSATDTDLELALGAYTKFFAADYACATQVNLYTVSPVITDGHTAKLRAVVSGISITTPLPRGTVTFKEGVTTLGSADLDASGTASLDVEGLSLGDHTITAEFSGNSTVGAATSSSIVQKVTPESSSITISLGASTHNEAFESTVVVRDDAHSAIGAYYYVTVDGVTEIRARWSDSPLSLSLPAGTHSIHAEFLGNTVTPASTSPVYDFTTMKHAVTLTKTGVTTVRAGTAHAVQIEVLATTSPAPTGTVELFRGATSLGSGTLTDGVVTINATLPRGQHTCTAAYSGDANYLTGSAGFSLNVVANAQVAIDAHALDSTISIPAVVPATTTATMMVRSVSGANSWSIVSGWSLANPVDDGTGLTRGVLYDYRLDALTQTGLQQSNVDSALLYTDNILTAESTVVKFAHYEEVRQSINALRTMAGLGPVTLDGTFALNMSVLASHVAALRTAADQARAALGMDALSYTDPAPSGLAIKAAHVTELRDAAR